MNIYFMKIMLSIIDWIKISFKRVSNTITSTGGTIICYLAIKMETRKERTGSVV